MDQNEKVDQNGELFFQTILGIGAKYTLKSVELATKLNFRGVYLSYNISMFVPYDREKRGI